MTNPLLDFTGLPRFDAIRPEHVTPAVDALLGEARAAVERVATDPNPATWDSVVEPIAEALDRLDRAWSAAGHLNAVVNTPALRDAYNANQPKLVAFFSDMAQDLRLFAKYRSLREALDSLKARPVASGRRIAILGDMLELGVEAPAYHEGLAPHLAGVDGVYCVGPLMRHLYDLLPAGKGLGWHENPATLEPGEIATLLRGGDVVVVKGSKKMFWVNKFVPRLAAALQARARA